MLKNRLRIFLSYSSLDRIKAEEISLALEAQGHAVFFDRADLRGGEDYGAVIRNEIANADLFIFLITPASVKQGAYTLSELRMARDKWPHPKGYLLPVLLEPTVQADIPAYVRSVTFFQPEGNAAAEIAVHVGGRSSRRSKLNVIVPAVVIVIGILVIGIRFLADRNKQSVSHPPSCLLVAEFRASLQPSGSMPEGLVLHVVAGGMTEDFIVNHDGDCHFQVEASQDTDWSVDLTSADGLAWGRTSLRGCPTDPIKVALDAGSTLTIRPQ